MGLASPQDPMEFDPSTHKRPRPKSMEIGREMLGHAKKTLTVKVCSTIFIISMFLRFLLEMVLAREDPKTVSYSTL